MILALLISMAYAEVDRFIKIDSIPNGFGLYRMSRPDSEKEMKEVCDKGITKIFVLSGDAEDTELKFTKHCKVKVIYNEKQSAKVPVTKEFLKYFDDEIEYAQAVGEKIAFRCASGSHRTGRLASWYRMKWQNWKAEDAIEEMEDTGIIMWAFPMLDNQVRAMDDYLNDRECSEKSKHCVQDA